MDSKPNNTIPFFNCPNPFENTPDNIIDKFITVRYKFYVNLAIKFQNDTSIRWISYNTAKNLKPDGILKQYLRYLDLTYRNWFYLSKKAKSREDINSDLLEYIDDETINIKAAILIQKKALSNKESEKRRSRRDRKKKVKLFKPRKPKSPPNKPQSRFKSIDDIMSFRGRTVQLSSSDDEN